MTRIIQPSDGKGSLKDIQILINKNQSLIDKTVKENFVELADENIVWKSPIENDGFAEYRDNEFIERLGLDQNVIQLNDFWPKKGAQWDALATTSAGKLILVEAKANIPELVTPGTGARDISKKLIDKSLCETKEYLGIKNEVDWSGKFYQYTNRLAHLYFLRVKCNQQAYLINIYFTNDETVSGPKTKVEWEGALKVLYSFLGLNKHKLSNYIADIFIDTNLLEE